MKEKTKSKSTPKFIISFGNEKFNHNKAKKNSINYELCNNKHIYYGYPEN